MAYAAWAVVSLGIFGVALYAAVTLKDATPLWLCVLPFLVSIKDKACKKKKEDKD